MPPFSNSHAAARGLGHWARHLRQNLASTGARSRLPSSIVPPQLTQVMAVLLRGDLETRKLCAEPIDRFLSVPPLAHLLAVAQALLADVVRRSPFLAAIGLRLESCAVLRAGSERASTDVLIQVP